MFLAGEAAPSRYRGRTTGADDWSEGTPAGHPSAVSEWMSECFCVYRALVTTFPVPPPFSRLPRPPRIQLPATPSTSTHSHRHPNYKPQHQSHGPDGIQRCTLSAMYMFGDGQPAPACLRERSHFFGALLVLLRGQRASSPHDQNASPPLPALRGRGRCSCSRIINARCVNVAALVTTSSADSCWSPHPGAWFQTSKTSFPFPLVPSPSLWFHNQPRLPPISSPPLHSHDTRYPTFHHEATVDEQAGLSLSGCCSCAPSSTLSSIAIL